MNQATSKAEKYARTLEMKQSMNITAEFPKVFQDYFSHCASLEFTDAPDYDFLRRNFLDFYEASGFGTDAPFDWDILNI